MKLFYCIKTIGFMINAANGGKKLLITPKDFHPRQPQTNPIFISYNKHIGILSTHNDSAYVRCTLIADTVSVNLLICVLHTETHNSVFFIHRYTEF